jgi:hypothetical protein
VRGRAKVLKRYFRNPFRAAKYDGNERTMNDEELEGERAKAKCSRREIEK